MNSKLFLIILVSFLCLVPVGYGIESSVPLEFQKDYPIVSKEINLQQEIQFDALQRFGILLDSVGSVGFSGSIESNLEFSENMILTTTVSDDYVSAGENVDVTLEPMSAISLIKIHGDISGSINWDAMGSQGSIPISLKEFDVSHALSEDIGKKSTVVMDEETLYSGTIPVLGLQIEIFARPILEYTPRLWGVLTVDGPAIVQEGLFWNGDELIADVRFTETSPVSIELSSPYLILDQFKACMNVYMIASTVTFGPSQIDLIELGSYELTEDNVVLINMEPDLYELIQIMQETSYPDSGLYLELRDDVRLLDARLNDTLIRVSSIESELNQLSGEIKNDLTPLIVEVDDINSEVDHMRNSIAVLHDTTNTLESSLVSYTADANANFIEINEKLLDQSSTDMYLGIVLVLTIVLVGVIILILRQANIFPI